MEALFGADFSRVRVHADAGAARAASRIGARAFTVGADVYFAEGQFRPQQPEGRGLLAHELTHVLQQAPGPMLRPAASGHRASASDPLEREAEHNEMAVLQGASDIVGVSGRASGGSIQKSAEPGWIDSLRAAASGGLGHLADLVREQMPDRMSAGAVALDDLRRSLAGQSSVAIAPEAVQGLRSAHEQARSLAPDWLRIPSLDFTPIAHAGPAIALAAVPVVAESATTTVATGAIANAGLRAVAVEATVVAAEVLLPAVVVQILLAALIVLEVILAVAVIVGLIVLVRQLLEKESATAPAAQPDLPMAPRVEPAGKADKETIPVLPPAIAARTSDQAESQATDTTEERRRRGPYPLCWPVELGCPCATKFRRVRASELDETDEGQEILKRDPRFTARIQRTLKTTEINILLKDSSVDIHHRHPLFLGGTENLETNALVLSRSTHRKGHGSLNYQPQMLFPPPPLRPLSSDILKHPSGTEYYLAGMKDSRDSTCLGAIVPNFVLPCSCEEPDLGILIRNLLNATEPPASSTEMPSGIP